MCQPRFMLMESSIISTGQSSPSQSCHTVDSDAAARLLSELQLQQVQPIIHNLVGGRSAIIKRPILEVDMVGGVKTTRGGRLSNWHQVR